MTPAAAFRRAFGAPPDLVVRAPGRVNLIGDHTDYTGGWVLPAALPVGTDIAVRRRADRRVQVVAARLDARDETTVDDPRPTDGPSWTRYPRGVVALLLAGGHPVPGADVLIDGDLPVGAGLSSSAALEVGLATALLALAGRALGPVSLAVLGHRVENEIVGVRSGVMDQLAVAAGVAGHALLIDTRALTATPVPVPDEVRLLVLDSAVPRTLAGSAYNDRRAECESALRALQASDPTLRALRDVTPERLIAEAPRLDPVALRRARHVVTENARVLATADALRRAEVETAGRLMTASHASLRDDYAVSTPALDALVEIALATPGVLGARLTGAGFGGCAVALVRPEVSPGPILRAYADATGHHARVIPARPAVGARITYVSA